jgi:hypothetical protein
MRYAAALAHARANNFGLPQASFDAWSELVAQPARWGLSAEELVYLTHVLLRWDGADAWPCLSIETVSSTSGATERDVRDWRAALVDSGWLHVRPGPDGADEHDLSPLLARLRTTFIRKERRP